MIYVINLAVFIFYCLDDFLFGINKRGYYLKWRIAYSTLNLLLYNRLAKEKSQ